MRTRGQRERDAALDRGEIPGQPSGPGPDPAERPWSAEMMLLALIADEMRILRWFYASAHASGGNRPVRPPMVTRPGVARKEIRPHATSLNAEQRRRLDPRLRQRERRDALTE